MPRDSTKTSTRPRSVRRRGLALPALTVCAALVGTVGAAAADARAATAVPRGRTALGPGEVHLEKASSELLRARQLALAGASSAEMRAAEPGLRLRGGLAEVEIKLATLTPELVAHLAALGLEIDRAHLDHARVYGRLDPARLAAVTALPEVRIVRSKPRVGRRAGSVTSQADMTMNAKQARMTPNLYDGSGVVVGILSDSYNDSRGGTESGDPCVCNAPDQTCSNVVIGMANQTLGDLPSPVTILDDCSFPGAVPGDPCFGLIDEGAAIGELIMDLAPGADQMFHSAFNSPLDFAGGITELVNCGADVIVDDVFWTGQPFFQDGEIAAAAQDAVDAGVPFFSAAGNDATFGIDDSYLDSDPLPDTRLGAFPDGSDFHDFGGGDTFAAITVPDDCEIFAELQWAEPFFDPGPPAVGASSDLDLYLLASAIAPANAGPPGSNILFQSVTGQGCGTVAPDPDGDPYESVSYTNQSGGPMAVFLAIDKFCGPIDPLDLRVVTLGFGSGCGTTGSDWDFEDGIAGFDPMGQPIPDPTETPIFVDAQIFGHPAADGVAAVAAIFYGEIDFNGGVDPPFGGQIDVEPFSSLGGGLPFFFDRDGAPDPQTRAKPDFSAPDGVNNTFFGLDIVFDDPDSNPNFFGTSASAPNAAGVAALMRHATENKLDSYVVRSILAQSEQFDPEAPGHDDLAGSGAIDAARALSALDSSIGPLIDDLEFDLDGRSFFVTPPSTPQRLQAIDSIRFEDGDFSGLDAFADTHIFADGFESGDTSAWGH